MCLPTRSFHAVIVSTRVPDATIPFHFPCSTYPGAALQQADGPEQDVNVEKEHQVDRQQRLLVTQRAPT